jgi:hypothetical protein
LPDSNINEDPETGEKPGQLQQKLSSECRKFLAPLHTPNGEKTKNAIFFMGRSLDFIESRISSFPKVEVACAEAPDCDGAVWASLFNMDIVRNPNFKKK